MKMKRLFTPTLVTLAVTLSFAVLVNMNSAGAQSAQNGDYDADDDSLIEVSYLDQLNAIRWDLDGNGVPDRPDNANAYAVAFPGADPGMGCPNTRCTGYELTRDFDFDNPSSYASGTLNTRWTDGVGWLPIGFVENYFRAAFDGNDHTIANLFIKRSGRDEPGVVGLFGTNRDAGTIRHVGLVDVNVTGVDQVGGLVGSNSGMISDSYVTGVVSGNDMVGGLVGLVGYNTGGITWSGGSISRSYTTSMVSGNDRVGGLVGYMYGTITDSYATGAVSGNHAVGGLVGSSLGDGTISSSYATGSVLGNNSIGGLIGSSRDARTSVSYATGEVSGGNQVGGLIGSNGGSGRISASYSTSKVSGNDQVGGLVGHSNDKSTIITSYALGRVSGNDQIGGLVGLSADTAGIINSYWNTQTTGLSLGVGEGSSDGTHGKTSRELQQPIGYTDIFTTWLTDSDNADEDFDDKTGIDDVWDFRLANQYPILKADLDGDGMKGWEEFGTQVENAPEEPPWFLVLMRRARDMIASLESVSDRTFFLGLFLVGIGLIFSGWLIWRGVGSQRIGTPLILIGLIVAVVAAVNGLDAMDK